MTRICVICTVDLDALGKRRDALTCGAGCRRAKSRLMDEARDSQRSVQKRANRQHGGVSGLQVSYRKAVNAVAVAGHVSTTVAEAMLRPALSDVQRSRLEARS